MRWVEIVRDDSDSASDGITFRSFPWSSTPICNAERSFLEKPKRRGVGFAGLITIKRIGTLLRNVASCRTMRKSKRRKFRKANAATLEERKVCRLQKQPKGKLKKIRCRSPSLLQPETMGVYSSSTNEMNELVLNADKCPRRFPAYSWHVAGKRRVCQLSEAGQRT